ncbi:TorF family putative porin [Pseudomonas sp. NPDC089392]|uniref:TorF family putative porin n=1 Tax=Pseudomonas sp. NPDC089392 TaxID=3364459 RepID=UPI00380876C0
MRAAHPHLFFGLALLSQASHAVPLTEDMNLQVKLSALSEYRSRGISQTLGDPAAQLEIILIHNNGLYAGVWTSNVDFGSAVDAQGQQQRLDTRQELDYYAGYYWQISDAISLDMGYMKYSYPKNSEFNMSEAYAIFGAYGAQLGVNYSSDVENYFGKHQDTLYTYLGYKTLLPAEVGLDMRYGRNDMKDPAFFAGDGNTRDGYREWQVRLSREFVGLTWELSYIDTDLSQSECALWYGYTDSCSATVVVGVSKAF